MEMIQTDHHFLECQFVLAYDCDHQDFSNQTFLVIVVKLGVSHVFKLIKNGLWPPYIGNRFSHVTVELTLIEKNEIFTLYRHVNIWTSQNTIQDFLIKSRSPKYRTYVAEIDRTKKYTESLKKYR